MRRKTRVVAIVVKYDEPGWFQQTLDCVKQAGLQYIVKPRLGIGPLSSAFNAGMRLLSSDICDYAWHLTNVTFQPEMVKELVSHFSEDVASVHPKFQSEHAHICGTGCKDGQYIPFVEWTAPMVSMEAWETVGELDEAMPYWGMDLDWSHRAKLAGFHHRVCTTYELGHDYLNRLAKVRGAHEITKSRRVERAKFDRSTQNALREKWGEHWLEILWPNHENAGKKKAIYD